MSAAMSFSQRHKAPASATRNLLVGQSQRVARAGPQACRQQLVREGLDRVGAADASTPLGAAPDSRLRPAPKRQADIPDPRRTVGETDGKRSRAGFDNANRNTVSGASVAHGAESHRSHRLAQTDVFSNIGARVGLVLRLNPSVTFSRPRA